MKREIKFRAYNKDWNMMVPSEDIIQIYFDGVTAEACGVKFNITTTDGQRHDNVWEDDEDLILMQFTGLKDKNGVEIYEGDILHPINPPSPKNDNRVVEFIEGSFCYNEATTRGNRGYWSLNNSKARLFEVIGNIYEHPHLLADNHDQK